MRSRQREFADCACGGDASDLAILVVDASFAKPEVPVSPIRHTVELSLRGGQGELADRACSGDTPNLPALTFGARRFGEPEIAVWPRRDTASLSVGCE